MKCPYCSNEMPLLSQYIEANTQVISGFGKQTVRSAEVEKLTMPPKRVGVYYPDLSIIGPLNTCLMMFVTCGIWPLIALVIDFSNNRHRKQDAVKKKQDAVNWEAAFKVWSGLYYCEKCGLAFDEGHENPIQAKDVQSYIYLSSKPSASTPNRMEPGVYTCSACQVPLKPGMLRCEKCGLEFQEPVPEQPSA
jgi:ribosomal protein L37AE/L43A